MSTSQNDAKSIKKTQNRTIWHYTRLNKEEEYLLTKYANNNGIPKATALRMLMLKGLEQNG